MEIVLSPSELLELSAFIYFFKLNLLTTANTSWLEFQWAERPRRRLCCTFLNDTWVWPSAAATIMERWQSARCRCSRQNASPCMRRVNLWPWSSRQLRFCRPRSELKQMILQFAPRKPATFTFIFRQSKAFCVPSHKDPLPCTTAKPGFVLQACTESQQLLQPFYRVDVVLSFKETNHKMHWSMENTLPCAGECAAHQHIKLKWWLIIGWYFDH